MTATGTPTLEMLWESADPATVLTDRFGLPDADAAATWVSGSLADRWGIQDATCRRIVMSDSNALAWVDAGPARLLLKWSVAEAKFERLAGLGRLVQRLGERGMPVSAPVPARDGSLQLEFDGVSAGVQQVVDGDLLDVTDAALVRCAGATLARLHLALREVPDADAPACPPSPALREQFRAWDAWAQHVPDDLRRPLRELAASLPDPPAQQQLVHGDIRAANLLCRDHRVVAMLDFEELRRDLPVVELARGAVLLGTWFHDWGPVPASVRATFRAGYESVRPLTDAEGAWWDALVLLSTLQFVPAGDDPTGWAASARDQLDRLGA